MLRSFIQAARLRLWMTRPQCPAAIKECLLIFNKWYRSATKSSDTWYNEQPENCNGDSEDESKRSFVQVPLELREFFSGQIKICARHVHNGIVYSRHSTHSGNSLIEFYPNGVLSKQPVPGSITFIVKSGKKTVFVVQRQLPASPETIDPFVHYPHFPAKLFSADLSDRFEVVEVDWVISHVARWKMGNGNAVILSLSRVGIYSCY
jgi:hypothetical protein